MITLGTTNVNTCIHKIFKIPINNKENRIFAKKKQNKKQKQKPIHWKKIQGGQIKIIFAGPY